MFRFGAENSEPPARQLTLGSSRSLLAGHGKGWNESRARPQGITNRAPQIDESMH